MSGPIPDHEIERVAIRICDELGLDPYQHIWMRRRDTLTYVQLENQDPAPKQRLSHQLPKYLDQYGSVVTPPPFEAFVSGSYYLDEPINTPRWYTFRRDAEAAIAGWRAVHHYMLLET